MSDSVDRVFSYALNTVNKIRTGSEKPPAAIRLKLYGLYKQSMEGDVDGIMDRPEGDSEEAHRAQEKWDAWKQQNGVSRTEAKRRYISTLIDTMHKYASPSPDARELVAELEFVWDQVKSNVPSSSSSSPLQTLGMPSDLQNPPSYHALGSSQASHDNRPSSMPTADAPMRVLSPVSQEREDEAEEKDEEFVDAPDSQYDIIQNSERDHSQEDSQDQRGQSQDIVRRRSSPSLGDQKWKRRVEQALVKMTAEVAALREQLESRRFSSRRRRHSPLGWLLWLSWAAIKHITVDVFILGIILLWMRRKKDRRLEGAVRVLLGDAVAQVQKVGGAQMANIQKIQFPRLPSRKS